MGDPNRKAAVNFFKLAARHQMTALHDPSTEFGPHGGVLIPEEFAAPVIDIIEHPPYGKAWKDAHPVRQWLWTRGWHRLAFWGDTHRVPKHKATTSPFQLPKRPPNGTRYIDERRTPPMVREYREGEWRDLREWKETT